jgi:hypothetical protein
MQQKLLVNLNHVQINLILLDILIKYVMIIYQLVHQIKYRMKHHVFLNQLHVHYLLHKLHVVYLLKVYVYGYLEL